MSEIRLLIEDYSSPWAETYCTVQSYKLQQGGVAHVPVRYGVSTDFPGVVTLTTSDGVAHAVTSGTEVTAWLDEGGLLVRADATGALINGVYYVYLRQDESTLELQIRIDVSVAYVTCVEYPTLGVSRTDFVVSGDCSDTLTFEGEGAYLQLSTQVWGVPVAICSSKIEI